MATPENRLNYARNKIFIEKLIPRIMAQIHKWLYKGGSQSLKDYLESVGKLNKYDVNEKERINEGVDISKMDTKLLYKLLQHTCGLSTNDPDWYKTPQPGEKIILEKVLYKLKSYRNTGSHPDPTTILNVSDGDLDKFAADLKVLFTEALNMAGKRGSITKKEIKAAKTQAEKELHDERFAESGGTIPHLIENCHKELKLQDKDKTLFSPDLYLQPRLLAEEKDPSTGASRVQEIPCKDLLTYSCQDSSRPEFLVLVGETGAGKTSFCQYVLRTWLEHPEEMETLENVQLVLGLQCSEINMRDLHYYLRTKLLPKTTGPLDTSALTRIMSQAKVLWVVDGWDEATPEAKDLVKELLTTKPDSHTVLITSRPEMSHELYKEFSGKKRSIRLSFAELSITEKNELVKKNIDSNVNKNGKTLIDNFVANPDVNNPLLLVLMANLWIQNHGKGKAQDHLSLTQLYAATNKLQMAQLVGKYKHEVSENRAKAIVEKYLECICKIAFTTISNGPSLKLDQQNVKLLEKTCTKVNSKHAFSTFFRFNTNPSAGAEYSFHQPSQRLFYAALHVKDICSKSESPESKLSYLFKTCVDVNYHINPYLGVYDILIEMNELTVNVLSCLTCGWFSKNRSPKDLSRGMKRMMKKVLNLATFRQPPEVKNQNIYYSVLLMILEMITDENFETNITVHCLVNLLSHIIGKDANPNMCFEVLHEGNFRKELVKELSVLVNLEKWCVADRDLKATYKLLQYVTPNEVEIYISGPTENLPDLLKTVEQLAERKVKVDLCFNWEYSQLRKEFSCEKYLEILCSEKAKCILTTFGGHLSHAGMKHLINSTQLQTLAVRVTKESTMTSLSANAQNFPSLKSLQLIYDLDQFVKLRTSLDGSVKYIKGKKTEELFRRNEELQVDLQLPRLQDSLLKSAITFISMLHKHYNSLNVLDLQYKNVTEFILGLKSNGVRVNTFIKPMCIKSTGQYVKLNFGSLPPKDITKDILVPWQIYMKKCEKL